MIAPQKQRQNILMVIPGGWLLYRSKPTSSMLLKIVCQFSYLQLKDGCLQKERTKFRVVSLKSFREMKYISSHSFINVLFFHGSW